MSGNYAPVGFPRLGAVCDGKAPPGLASRTGKISALFALKLGVLSEVRGKILSSFQSALSTYSRAGK